VPKFDYAPSTQKKDKKVSISSVPKASFLPLKRDDFVIPKQMNFAKPVLHQDDLSTNKDSLLLYDPLPKKSPQLPNKKSLLLLDSVEKEQDTDDSIIKKETELNTEISMFKNDDSRLLKNDNRNKSAPKREIKAQASTMKGEIK
jgi:hypothetical protein